MSNSILNATIHISENNADNEFEGILKLHSKETLNFDTIDAAISFEARGRMSSIKRRLLSFKIDTNKRISQNETLEIPFNFKLEESNLETYSGKNVSFYYNCEIKVHVDENDLDKLDRGVFTRVKSFFTSDYSSTFSTYFDRVSSKQQFDLSEKHQPFKLSFSFSNVLIPLLIVGGGYIGMLFSSLFEFHDVHIFILIIATAIATIINFKINSKKIGQISLQTVNDGDGFICMVKPARNFSLQQAKMYYQIVEEVVDRRGTSSKTYTSSIYTSPTTNLKSKGSSEVRFPFPEKKVLPSFKFEDVSIYWQVVITGTHNGMKEKMTCGINVYYV